MLSFIKQASQAKPKSKEGFSRLSSASCGDLRKPEHADRCQKISTEREMMVLSFFKSKMKFTKKLIKF
ncbi:MAG: hypothetical protein BGO76_02310 [Caedibacter sp. 38-128]|nr:MAG: hypothetical protein BGO76_02310 [Caedibacter sp. 38-128]